MKQTIQLRLGQQLTMTPQLQQAIRLLQLSTIELQREIQEALESNLMLEAETADDERDGGLREFQSNDYPPEEYPSDERARHDAEARVDDELRPEQTQIPEELPVDSGWDDTYDSYASPSAQTRDDDEFDPFAVAVRPLTLRDHIDWQLNLVRFDARERAIAETLVDAIDTNGYLRLDLAELPGIVGEPELEGDEIEAVLHRIQSFDPPGVGARDLRECLLLQLRQLQDADAEDRAVAITIVTEAFDALGRNDFDALRRHTKLDDERLGRALRLIRSLNPRPGSMVADLRPEYLVPDVVVRKRDGRWLVELNPDSMPRIRVNADYLRLVRRAERGSDQGCLRTHLQEARWLIKSLASRHDTVLRVATKIVELQQAFFDSGEEAMKPLVLRDVAEALELHESTVSRVTSRKYMHTPRGIFEFKYFFSSHVNTSSGGECSSTAIRALIRKLLAAETANKPLSDSKIAQALSEQGIEVARRTVAKYREAMGIPPSNERKRLA